MKILKIGQVIKLENDTYKVTSLDAKRPEVPSFNAVRLVKSRNEYSKQPHCLSYAYLERLGH